MLGRLSTRTALSALSVSVLALGLATVVDQEDEAYAAPSASFCDRRPDHPRCQADEPEPEPAPAPTAEPPAEPTPTDTSAVTPKGVPGTWRLAWQDEFDGSTLDLSKWRPNWLAGSDTAVTKPINSAELSCYDPAQVSVAGGAANLTAVKRQCTGNDGKTYGYASGIIQSRHDFMFTYGYTEARVYLPPSTDSSLAPTGSCGPNWAAVWTNGLHDQSGWPEDGEIDIMECLSGNDASWHYHSPSGSDGGYPSAWQDRMPATADGWHTFGVNWQPGSLTFYYDGVEVGRQTSGVTSSAHYVIANLAVSGSEIAVPQTMKVDYVRVWKPA